MKKALKALAAAAVLASASVASATPSTVVWTPATTYTQPFLIPHITYDTYFGERTSYATDLGLTIGVVPDNKWVEGEVGVDAFYPLLSTPTGSNAGKYETKSAFQFNGKLSLKEGALHELAPGLSVGIMNVGLTKDLTDYNILHASLGKTFGPYGTVAVGYYQGNDKLLLKNVADPAGVDAFVADKKDESGFMASYASPKLAIGTVGLKDISFAVDYMSGESAFGALGAAVALYFTDAVSFLTGPVYFNNKYSAASVGAQQLVWTAQLDVDIDFAKPAGK